ncbi:MAG TPA: class I SAM-dependent RNA methyltransferase [Gemmatimonadaceae bacterium]|nr:class I SAM-dependent RNA methyltransferase [Gemmatimonadaceae bacterium]
MSAAGERRAESKHAARVGGDRDLESYRCFAVCAPGLETLVAAELQALGIDARVAEDEPGGVAFDADAAALYRANLHLRTASRVLVRLGHFHVRALGELERRARELAWERFIGPGRAVRLRVTCRKSRLYHSGAVAERIANALTARSGGLTDESSIGNAVGVRGERSGRPPDDDEVDDNENQLVVVRIFHDRCTVSIDASGALLHRRGYRLATAKAPLRETLAAALLLSSEWDPHAPLLDPMCGSGTIAIEGALLARRIASGLRRSFAFVEWPEFDRLLWERVLDDARALVLPSAPAIIQGSDRDAGAIEAAVANAERAGVAADVEFSRRAISAIAPPPVPGWVVTNPPYGARVGERDRLRNLYSQLGNVLRARCSGWTIVMLSADAHLDSRLGVPLETILKTRNGGIPVHATAGVVGGKSEGSGKREAGSSENP